MADTLRGGSGTGDNGNMRLRNLSERLTWLHQLPREAASPLVGDGREGREEHLRGGRTGREASAELTDLMSPTFTLFHALAGRAMQVMQLSNVPPGLGGVSLPGIGIMSATPSR